MPKVADEYLEFRKEQILNTTKKCLVELGYERTTIREIAGRMGISVGVVYRYFKNKENLFDTLYTRTLENRQKYFDFKMRETENSPDFLKHLMRIILGYNAKTGKASQKRARIMTDLIAESLKRANVRAALNKQFRQFEKNISLLVKDGIEKGKIENSIDPTAFAGCYHALIWGFCFQLVLIDELDVDRFMDKLEPILYGPVITSQGKDNKP